jgi:hypothetical protein
LPPTRIPRIAVRSPAQTPGVTSPARSDNTRGAAAAGLMDTEVALVRTTAPPNVLSNVSPVAASVPL